MENIYLLVKTHLENESTCPTSEHKGLIKKLYVKINKSCLKKESYMEINEFCVLKNLLISHGGESHENKRNVWSVLKTHL